MNKKGFTLIEILTVIVILGVIMIIAVPAVSKYILGSRDSAYVTSIEKYIEAARNEVTDFEYIVSRDDTTYYIPTKCLKVENGENSPYGEMQESYVVVTTNKLGKHKFYYLGRDETNHGMTLTPSDEVDTDHLSSEVTIIDNTQMLDGTTRVAVYKDDCSKQTESTTNTSLANCGTVTGESDVWTKDDRTITVECVGNCMNPSYTNVFRATKKEGIIQITDRENNVKNCRVKVHVDKTIPVVGLRGIKKNSGTLVASETWSNEGLNFMFVNSVVAPSGTTIYYCQDLNNTCTPNKLARPGETIIGYNNLVGIYYIRYKAISGVGLESEVRSYKAMIDTDKPTCSLKTFGTKNTQGTVYLTDVTIAFESANDSGGSDVKEYGIGSVSGAKQVVHSENSDSPVTYTGYVEDLAGNTNICEITFTKNSELTLTYNNNNGSGCTSKIVNYGGTYGELCTPTRTGYSFDGWYTSASGGTQVNESTNVTQKGDHTIYARWIGNELIFAGTTITKTFSTSSQTATFTGATNGTGSYTYAEKSEKNSSGTATNYISLSGTTITIAASTPVGTYTYVVTAKDSNSLVTKDATFTITINKRNCDVVVSAFGHDDIRFGDEFDIYNDATTNLWMASKECSDFSINISNNNVLRSGTLITADDDVQSWPNYDIYSWANYGKYSVVDAAGLGSTNVTITVENGSNYNAQIVTFKVNVIANIYTITLDRQSGTGGTATIYEKYNTGWYSNSGATTSITSVTVPTRTGYTFGGYYTATNGEGTQIIAANGTINSGRTTTFSANGTLYAKWTANTYTVTLNGNGATTAGSASTQVTYNATSLSSISLPQKKYTVSFNKNGTGATATTTTLTATYTFNGWYQSAGGGNKIASNGGTPVLQGNVSGYTDENGKWIRAADTTLYARWMSSSVTLPTITKSGSICTWNTVADGTGTSYNGGISFTPTENTTLYARCRETKATITCLNPSNLGKTNVTIATAVGCTLTNAVQSKIGTYKMECTPDSEHTAPDTTYCSIQYTFFPSYFEESSGDQYSIAGVTNDSSATPFGKYLTLQRGASQYGPYYPVKQGCYKIVYTGRNFATDHRYVDSYGGRRTAWGAQSAPTSNYKNYGVSMPVVASNHNSFYYYVNVNYNNEQALELRFYACGTRQFQIYSISIIPEPNTSLCNNSTNTGRGC